MSYSSFINSACMQPVLKSNLLSEERGGSGVGRLQRKAIESRLIQSLHSQVLSPLPNKVMNIIRFGVN